MTKEPFIGWETDNKDHGGLFFGVPHAQSLFMYCGPPRYARLKDRPEFGARQYGFLQVCGLCFSSLVVFSHNQGAVEAKTEEA